MKKVKQIAAILGIVLLLGLNVLLVWAAGLNGENSMNTFNAAIVAVIMVPVLLWIYLYIYKLIKKNREDEQLEEDLAEDLAEDESVDEE